jgi:hypothetical protein
VADDAVRAGVDDAMIGFDHDGELEEPAELMDRPSP